MAGSKATTVASYLKGLPVQRRRIVEAVRKVILKNLPHGYRETTNWGMISYEIPLETYPDTYNKQPISYLALAAQKHHYGLYAMNVYCEPGRADWLKDQFRKKGKKLDMGKSCIRFREIDDLPLDVIAKLVSATSVKQFIKIYEASRR